MNASKITRCKIEFVENDLKIKGIASVEINGDILLTGIQIVEGFECLFIQYPWYRENGSSDTKYHYSIVSEKLKIEIEMELYKQYSIYLAKKLEKLQDILGV